jgi:hypothetical protein
MIHPIISTRTRTSPAARACSGTSQRVEAACTQHRARTAVEAPGDPVLGGHQRILAAPAASQYFLTRTEVT